MSFGNEPISAMTTQNNPSDLQHHDLVQDALCAPALMAPMVASKSIDSFLDPPTVMGLKPSGHLQQATYTMSAEHSQLDGSISNFPQLVLPEAAGSPDISRNNIPQNAIYPLSAEPFDTSPLRIPTKSNIPYHGASPGYFDKSLDVAFPTAVWEYNGYERDHDSNLIWAPDLKLSVSCPGAGASRQVVWDLALPKGRLISDGDSIRQHDSALKIVRHSAKVKSSKRAPKQNQEQRAPRQKRSRRPEGNACIRCLLSTHGKCVRESENQRCKSCQKIYSNKIKSNPQQTLSLAGVVFFELARTESFLLTVREHLTRSRGAGFGEAHQQVYTKPVVCSFYDKDEIPNPFSDESDPLVISREFSSLTSEGEPTSCVLPGALALDRAQFLRYIDQLIKRSIENRLLWAIKGIVTPALRCATGLAVLFNMEKFIIHETSNINLLEGQDLVAATILSVAYEIKDQLAILHNELMVSCIDSKDPVAIYCALQLLWSSVDSYKRLQGNQIPDLDSFLEDFRTLTPKALDIISGVKDAYGAHCCPMPFRNLQPYKDLIAAQKKFKPHLRMTYEKGDTLLLGNTYRSFSTGRSYQEVMNCKMPWDQAGTDTTIDPSESKKAYFRHPVNHLPSTTGNSIPHDQYPTSLDLDFLPSLTTGDSGPDDLLGASSAELAFLTGLDHGLNQTSFFNGYPYVENSYHYRDENEKQNYLSPRQGPWDWNTTSGDFFDDGQELV